MLLFISSSTAFCENFQISYLSPRLGKQAKSARNRDGFVASLSRVFVGDHSACTMKNSHHLRNLHVGVTLHLEEEETQHLKARRIKENEVLEVFDGTGYVGKAIFLGYSKEYQRNAKILVQSWTPVNAEEHVELTVGVGVPKGKRGDWLIEKLTEVGVDSVIPIRYERTNCESSVVDHIRQQRWRKICIAACKQCCRNYLMKIENELSFRDVISKQQETKQWDTVYVATLAAPFRFAVPQIKPTRVLGIVGPEGGLTNEEEKMVYDLGAHLVKLNRYTLRCETAATVLASLLRCNIPLNNIEDGVGLAG
ncbi:hypothetical protein GpartN1_g1132.t1 [Galdieria partita]|uniref:16S rRNA (uracil(1498)-N(3))-methyltransferase n=1 Tax=Galdieria partita TaxID=83374 RepID=A0A9C7UNB6_9RHOD|nr:hypothetical protein GpartN1_g1132.t1 [Galdieria partita]